MEKIIEWVQVRLHCGGQLRAVILELEQIDVQIPDRPGERAQPLEIGLESFGDVVGEDAVQLCQHAAGSANRNAEIV